MRGHRSSRSLSLGLLVLVVGLVIVVIVALGGGDESGNEPAAAGAKTGAPAPPAQLIVRGLNVDWINFDFQAENQNHNMPPIMAAYDRLLAYGENFKLQPYLASAWKVTPEDRATKVEFTLRKDATCADGTPVDADVVLNSFKRLMSVKKTANLMTGYFGPGPYKVSADAAAGTFTFETQTPARNLENGFAWPGSSIVCPAGLEAVKSNADALKDAMYGSGPYELASAVHADRITFKRRADWKWGPNGSTSASLPEKLIYRYVQDETTAANLLLTDGLDVGWVTGPDAQRVVDDQNLVHKVGQNYAPSVLAFNMYDGRATLDENLRAAIMAAIDPKAWNQAAYAGFGVVTRSLLLPDMDCYDAAVDTLAPKVDLAEAARLLEQGGYSRSGDRLTKDGKRVTLRVISPSNASATAADYLVDQLTKLGIQAKLGAVANYAEDAVQANFDVGVLTSTSVAPLPGINLPTFTGPAPPNGANLANAGGGDEEVASLAKLSTQDRGTAGCEAFSALQKRLIEKRYLTGLSAPSQQMGGRGWDFLPVQFWEISSFKYQGAQR